MSNATKDSSAGSHSGHWTTTANKSGTYEFNTAGKYVDRNIDLVIPEAAESVSGTASASVTTNVGTKASGKYPIVATAGTAISGTATATVNTAGFTDAASYSGSVSGTVSVSGSLDAIGLAASGSGSATISSVSVGTKGDSGYPITGSATGTGTATATISSSGYGKAGVESGTGSTSVSASLNATIPAASATYEFTGTATSPTVAKDSTTNVSSSAITTTKPTSGYYVAVKGTAPATTLSCTPTVNTGYLGAASEITASAATTAKNRCSLLRSSHK